MINEEMLNTLGLAVGIKDKSSKFIYCNERLAKLSGSSSPQDVIGKFDSQLVWRDHANAFVSHDLDVMQNHKRISLIELTTTHTQHNIAVFVLKAPYYNKHNDLVGIALSFSEIDVQTEGGRNGWFLPNNKFVFLYDTKKKILSRQQVNVLRNILLGKTVKSIAKILNISPRTVEEYLSILKDKMECHNKEELTSKAWSLGLSHLAAAIAWNSPSSHIPIEPEYANSGVPLSRHFSTISH